MSKRPQESRLKNLPLIVFAAMVTLSVGWLIVYPMVLGNERAVSANFMHGALPLVFLWLVVFAGLAVWCLTRMHAQTLALTALNRRTFEDSESLGRAVLRAQMETQRRADMKVVDLLIKDMNAQLAMIMERVGMVQTEEMETLWALTAAGNPWVIPSTFLASAELTGAGFRTIVSDRLIADSTATVALQTFLTRYEQMMRLLDTHDENRLMKEILGESPYERVIFLLTNILHRLYARLQARQDEKQELAAAQPPFEPAASPMSGTPEADDEPFSNRTPADEARTIVPPSAPRPEPLTPSDDERLADSGATAAAAPVTAAAAERGEQSSTE